MIVPDSSTPERDIGALIDELRQSSQADGLAALLPDNLRIYDGRSAAEMGRLRGYLLAAFADTGLPAKALPYVVESLETGYIASEVAGAAIGLRGLRTPSMELLASLLRAIDNISGVDTTVSFESYAPAWPYSQPTTALTELVRTIGHFGVLADAARPELGHLAQQRERFSNHVIDEMRCILDKAGAGDDEQACDAACACESCACTAVVELSPNDSCCAGMELREQKQDHASTRATLEDQNGVTASFEECFRDKPSVVAFFYTRCENPYKCSLTITKLAALQACIEQRGLTGALRVTAITYDGDFDLPNRLRSYGADRGIQFGEDARFFRVTAGFQDIRKRFDLGVNYGASTVNRHPTEVYVLNEAGDIAASFRRLQWDVEPVLRVVEDLVLKSSQTLASGQAAVHHL